MLKAMSIIFALYWPLSASGDQRFDTIGSLTSACLGFIDGTGLYLPKGICAGWIIGERELRSPACTAKRENWGGAFILFEKVRGPDARFQDMLTQTYNEFKVSEGFSADQIMAKSNSLKGVLEPFSTSGNLSLLKRAGFKDIMTVFKYGCFEGFLAIK